MALNLNRSLCALSGPIGRGIARGIDTVCKIAKLDEDTTSKARLAAGQFAAFVLASTGVPEAAVSILSSTGAMPYDPLELEEETKT